jgi:hypothetical protein
MCPTIRIDDDVYRWLQFQAIPFEDNPNSVLRRLAGLDKKGTGKKSGRAAVDTETPELRENADRTSPPPKLSSAGLSQGSTRIAGPIPAMAPAESAKRNETYGKRTHSGRRRPLARGADLIRRWKIPVRQARFHRDGSWYERLDRFPGSYCDRTGYAVFASEEDLRTTPGIRIEPSGQVWIPGGISSVRGYRKADDPLKEPDDQEDLLR